MRDLNKYAKICMKELDRLGIKYGNILEFRVNNKAHSFWGRCIKENEQGDFTIEICPVLLDERNDEKGLKNTIIHELLHSCEGCMNHSTKWKQYAAQVNICYGYNIKTKSTAAEKGLAQEVIMEEEIAALAREIKKPTYKVRCKKCGAIIERKTRCRVIQHPEFYRCKCGGELYNLE